MKENVIDVLLYLFENYIDTENSQQPDKDTLELELEQVGFQELEIHKALNWLDTMTVVAPQVDNPDVSIRVFNDSEMERLDVQCRGYLLFLEQVGVLDVETREVVIERVLALDSEEIDLEQLKWVVLMVLFNQPDKKTALNLMQDMVLADAFDVLH